MAKCWVLVCFVSIALPLLGFSVNSLVLYVSLTAVSFCVTCLFLTKKWELDVVFDFAFKLFELSGFGVPHRLENPTPSSFVYANGGFCSLNEISKPLENSFKKLLDNVICDFISSWYSNVGEGKRFVHDVRRALEMLCLEGYMRASQIDSHYLIEQLTVVFHGHLERFNKAVLILKTKDPKLRPGIPCSQLVYRTYESQLPSTLRSLSSPAEELSYLRGVVDSVLGALIPKETFGCNTGRFILREILTVKVLQPLATFLSDPDWINQALVDILRENGRDVIEVGPLENIVMKSFTDGCEYNTDQLPINAYHPSVTRSSSSEPLLEISGKRQSGGKKGKQSKELMCQTSVEEQFSESVDFNWSFAPERQSPLGESEHENPESFLVISLDNNSSRDDGVNNRVYSINNWSLEVVPSSSIENYTPSLSSSWGVCPSPEDKTFQSQSYRNEKDKMSVLESNANKFGTKLGEYGQNIKEMTCCHIFEESDDVYQFKSMECGRESTGVTISKGLGTRLRTRSLSHPGRLCVNAENAAFEEIFSCSAPLARSASVPCKLPFAEFSNLLSEIKAADDLVYGLETSYASPCYASSFCSNSDSFKSVSSDDDDVEQGEDALSIYDSHEQSSSRDLTSCFTELPPKNSRVQKQVIKRQESFDDNMTPKCELNSGNSLSSEVDPECVHVSYEHSQTKKELYSSAETMKALSNRNTTPDNMHSSATLGSEMSFSDLSFGDTFLNAGRKFVSNLKPPYKLESGNSGSVKSTEISTTSGVSSQEQPTMDQTSLLDDLYVKEKVIPDLVEHGPFNRRKLSRSDAVVLDSMESDSETCYSTSIHVSDQSFLRESSCSCASDRLKAEVIRIHPSDLISIPGTVVALETTWEPGRNKYTLYKIEYDIRIWREVYSRAVKEAKKERQKQMRLQLEPEGEELSVEAIKEVIPLRRLINRRYREFMELHNRLTCGDLGIHMKDILKPNRKYNLPFGRLDPHVVEGRRKLLQYYLVSLVSKSPLRNSQELKQFLGVTEGEHVSFIKPSMAQMVSQSVHVPRVDKMLSKQMTKMIDSIKTAFDSVEEAELAAEEFPCAAANKGCIPWKFQCGVDVSNIGIFTTDGNTDMPQDCYDAFCEGRAQFSSPTARHPVTQKEDLDGFSDEAETSPVWELSKESDCDESHRMRQPLGPRTAGDGSDNPDDFSAPSPAHDILTGRGAQGPSDATLDQRERAGAIVEEYLNDPVSNISTARLFGICSGQDESQPAPGSKFPLRPSKFLEAAKRIGNTSKVVPVDIQSALSGHEKKPGVFKKLLRETSLPILSLSSSTKSKETLSSKPLHLRPEEPCAQSVMDQPSNIDENLREVPSVSGLQCSLLHSLLGLSCELLQGQRSWVTLDSVQQAITATFGGLFEWYLQRRIDDITSEECWAYYLDQVIEAIWPGGTLLDNKTTTRTEKEKMQARNEAMSAITDLTPGLYTTSNNQLRKLFKRTQTAFITGIVKLLVGTASFHKGTVNFLESLQHSQVNRILLYTLLELILSDMVPEIQDDLQFFNYICSYN